MKPSSKRRRAGRAKVRTGKNDLDLQLFGHLLRSVALFLINEGVPPSEISRTMGDSLRVAEKQSSSAATLQSLYVALSKVLHQWHHNPAYLSQYAHPKPLSLRGRENSIEALAKAAGVNVSFDVLKDSLKAQRLIRRDARGRYRPTKQVARITNGGPELTGYLGQSILQLISTLHSNRLGRRDEPLLERAAIVQDLPLHEIPHFRRYTNQQGASFIASANGWLESRRKRRAKKGSGKVTTAGVHVFAFVTPPPKVRL